MALPAHPAEERATPSGRLLTDFTAATPDLRWIVVNDGVMGGRSRGSYKQNGSAIDFAGSTNTNGGGFSSIRTGALRLNLADFDGIRVRVRGDGRRYTWRLTTNARWRGRTVSYWADFDTKPGTWTTSDIPWANFKPQWRGMKLRGLELDPANIRGMGLMIYDKKDGPFALRLDTVSAYKAETAFQMQDLRWKKRVLVLYASSADDTRLKEQLARVARSRAAFDERDMELVVLLETKGSRVGTQAITSEAAIALRKQLRFEPGAFGLRLVGKDGGVKQRAGVPTDMNELYALIDSMPMRQSEMRR